jgi:chromosome segregation ATPase
MANPISDLQALARAPLDARRELAVIAQALQTLPEIRAELEPALADVRRLREIVAAQQEQVTHIEGMVQRIERRSEVLERSVVDLQAKADEAMRVLPNPDDEERGPLAKARDVITGG